MHKCNSFCQRLSWAEGQTHGSATSSSLFSALNLTVEWLENFRGKINKTDWTEWEKSSWRGACQHNLLPFLTWQQFPLGSCRSPMHFPSNPHFPVELPQPIRFWTSAGTELLQLSICFPLASFFLPVHLSYFCLGETSLLFLSVFLLLSPFSSLCLSGDTRLNLTSEETWRSECPSPTCCPEAAAFVC